MLNPFFPFLLVFCSTCLSYLRIFPSLGGLVPHSGIALLEDNHVPTITRFLGDFAVKIGPDRSHVANIASHFPKYTSLTWFLIRKLVGGFKHFLFSIYEMSSFPFDFHSIIIQRGFCQTTNQEIPSATVALSLHRWVPTTPSPSSWRRRKDGPSRRSALGGKLRWKA